MKQSANKKANRDGLLLVDKPTGCTSHDIVQRARRVLGQRKIGHCGTLDPEATGLLLLTLGKATRLTRFLIKAPKIYTGTIQLGATTDTYDAAGSVVATAPIDGLQLAAVEKVMHSFVGTYEQRPPAYSAKRIQGKRYFELARKGEEVPDTTSPVEVYDFRPDSPSVDGRLAGDPIADGTVPFVLDCASGTYARSLAHDTGQKLGCGAHLSSLRRLRIGGFRVEDAVVLPERKPAAKTPPAEASTEDAETAGSHASAETAPLASTAVSESKDNTAALEAGWVPFDEIVLPFEETVVDARQERRLTHGQTVLLTGLDGGPGDWVKLVSQRRRFIAVGSIEEQIGTTATSVVQPKIVFS